MHGLFGKSTGSMTKSYCDLRKFDTGFCFMNVMPSNV
jgi:hypothetical protein